MAADNFARVLAMKANSDLIDVNQLIDQLEELIGDIESYDLDTLFGRVNQNTADIETINGDSTVENSTYWKIANTDFVVGITKNTTTGKWEFANNDGTTTYIDFSQVATMPPNNASNVDRVVQYTGATTQNYITGYFYRCVAETSGGITTYVWKQLDVQDSTKHWVGTRAELTVALANGDIEDGTIILITDEPDVDELPTENSTNLVYSGGIYTALLGKEDVFRTITMPQPSQTFNGKILQFLGTTTNDYIHGFFYQCVEIPNTSPVEYAWECINVQGADDSLSNISENAVQNKVVTNALANKVDTVAGKGLSTNDYTTAEKTQLATNTTDIAELKAEHVELTQAEYDMIGNEKYSDNKEYFITDATPDDPTYIYGFHIDPDESDPTDCVTYLADAIGMTPAAMGTTAFNYGSWENAFFMPKPCMLKYDGTVDYYLDPNDYSKKADGTASDIADLSYGGNAMMEFPLIWYKFEQGIADGEGYFYVSNKRVDDTYHCWSNYDSDNNIIDHFYMAIYNGVTYDEKMRSISGITLTPWSTTAYSASATYAVGDKVNYNGRMWKCTTAVETAEAFDPEKWEQFAFNGNTTGTEEIAQASANDTTAKPEWYIDLWADRVLITGLLYLMGKSLDLQGTSGQGISTGSQAAKEAYVTGSLNDKGLFYGSKTATNVAVKVFGMENFWALVWHRTAGLIGVSTGYAYKLTHGTADGSTATAFGTSSTGYLTKAITKPSTEYVKQMTFGKHGLLPSVTGNGANSTKYYCDYYYNGGDFALVGGGSGSSGLCGLFVDLGSAVGSRGWSVAAALSCKPLA